MSESDDLLDARTRQFRDAAATGPAVGENTYKGLLAHAKPGLHAHLSAVVARHVAPGAAVLDLATGSGALAQRLKDCGYRVSGADCVPENFRLHADIPFQCTDFNGPFAVEFDQRFDAIVACEIIEHLENPRNFLRQCHTLLRKGGIAVVTSPNTCSAPSKAMFVRSNVFAWYSERDYERHGHISPLGLHAFRRCAQESGLEILDLHSFGSPWDHCIGSMRLRLLAMLIALIDTTEPGLRGDILVMVLRAPEKLP